MIPKFRVWDKDEKIMIDWIDLDMSKDGGEDDFIVFEPTGPVKSAITNPILMQSTALKDKNGIEIYEGDIIEFEDETYQNEAMVGIINRAQVIIDNIQGVFLKNFMVRDSVTYGDYTNYYDFPTHEKSLFFKQCRVVGNVFEDESLLEDE